MAKNVQNIERISLFYKIWQKTAKLTIYYSRSIQAKVKNSLILLEHKILEGWYSKGTAQESQTRIINHTKVLKVFIFINIHSRPKFVTALWGMFRIESNIWDGALHKNSPQLKTDGTSAKNLTSDPLGGSEHTSDYNLSSNQILKIKRKINFPVETNRLSLKRKLSQYC